MKKKDIKFVKKQLKLERSDNLSCEQFDKNTIAHVFKSDMKKVNKKHIYRCMEISAVFNTELNK